MLKGKQRNMPLEDIMNIDSATTVIQPHAMMQKRSEAPSHDIRGNKSGPSSAFADYLFGPASSNGTAQSKSASALSSLKQANQARS